MRERCWRHDDHNWGVDLLHCQSILVAVVAWHNIGSNSNMIMNAREGAGEIQHPEKV